MSDTRFIFRALLVLVAVSLATIVLLVFVWNQVTSNQQSTTRALCSFRDDLQKRVTSGDAFLEKHPNGIPGIPVATIRVSIVNEKHTLRALSPLVC